jgi:hypothetical protein
MVSGDAELPLKEGEVREVGVKETVQQPCNNYIAASRGCEQTEKRKENWMRERGEGAVVRWWFWVETFGSSTS